MRDFDLYLLPTHSLVMMMEILQCVGDFLSEDEVKELFAVADPTSAGKIELKAFIRLLVT
jgi:Ca2+-binding EF-hand superfamily protein